MYESEGKEFLKKLNILKIKYDNLSISDLDFCVEIDIIVIEMNNVTKDELGIENDDIVKRIEEIRSAILLKYESLLLQDKFLNYIKLSIRDKTIEDILE